MKRIALTCLVLSFLLLTSCSSKKANTEERKETNSHLDSASTEVSSDFGTSNKASVQEESTTVSEFAAVSGSTEASVMSGILPGVIENLDVGGTVADDAHAEPHSNSTYPPNSFFGEWVIDGSYQHATKNYISVPDENGVDNKTESFPVSLVLGDPRMTDFSDAKTVAGLNKGDVYYLNSDGNKVRHSILYDTGNDTLALGFYFEQEGKKVKALELDYQIQWIGWKMTLYYGNEHITYVPLATVNDKNKGIVTNCGDVVRGYQPIDEMVSIHPWWPAVKYLANTHQGIKANFLFDEDGNATISTEAGKNYDLTYRYSGNTMTLIDNEDLHLYSWLADWNKSTLEESVDEADLDQMSDEQIEELAEKHDEVLTALKEAFDAEGITVDIDEVTGRVSLDSAILFKYDDASLSNDGKKFLDKFLGVYASIMLDSKYANYVSQIVIEGHTDTQGDYDYNMKLSEKRAKSVAKYCLEESNSSLTKNDLKKLKKIVKTVGKSYDEPVYNDNSEVDMKASRRVVFKFMMSSNGS